MPTIPSAPYTYVKTRTTISDDQLAQAAYNAGFRGLPLVKAVAIALGESHGNTTALNDNREFSVGLWQINVNGYLGSRLQRWGLTRWTQLWDPETNAKAAYSLSNGGQKFGMWSVYNHGTYLRYMDRASAAAKRVDPSSPSLPPTGTGATAPSPDASKARAVLDWVASHPISQDPTQTWDQILTQIGTTDTATASYLRTVLDTLHVPLTNSIGRIESPLNPVGAFLTTVAGNTPPAPSVVDDLLGSGLTDFIEGFVPSIAHGFYFLIIIIIALVLIVVGFKASNKGTE